MSGPNLSRGRRAGEGSARKLAIISSVKISPPGDGSSWGGSTPPDPPGGGATTGKGVRRVTVQTPREIAVAISTTPTQASGSQPVLTKTIQIPSPQRPALAC